MEHTLHLERLTGTERLVLLLYYAGQDGRTSDMQIAADFAELFPAEAWNRDRVNTSRRTQTEASRRRHGGRCRMSALLAAAALTGLSPVIVALALYRERHRMTKVRLGKLAADFDLSTGRGASVCHCRPNE